MTLISDRKTLHKGRLSAYVMNLGIPVLIMALSAWLFDKYPWDIKLQNYYYQLGWYMNDVLWVQLIYKFGNVPALIVSIGALCFFAHSFRQRSRYQRNRKLYIFLVLAMILGPGIVVNSILKDNWGRPRPRELQIYGGKYQYEAPLQIDTSSTGKSFPCGHATMGFYFFAPALVLGLKRKLYQYVLSLFALLYGSLIGWVRIMQGGHFLSDVLYSGVIVYLCTYALWLSLSLDQKPFISKRNVRLRLKIWHKALFLLSGIAIVAGVLLATPYSKNQQISNLEVGNKELVIDIQKAHVSLFFSDSLYVANKVQGFGFPGSKALMELSEEVNSIGLYQNVAGFFTEMNSEIQIVADTLCTKNLRLSIQEGDLFIDASAARRSQIGIQEETSEVSDSSKKYIIKAQKVIYRQ